FFKRHRRKLRIGTNRPERDELLQAKEPALFDELDSHHRIVVEKFPRVRPVGADATDARGKMNDNVGLGVVVKSLNGFHVHQIVFAAARHKDVTTASLSELFNNKRAQEASAASDCDAFAGKKTHSSPHIFVTSSDKPVRSDF